MNENIIPYVPIADRVQAKTEKSRLLCQQLFTLIDQCVSAQFTFNHDTEKGYLSICPDQINDLLLELSKSEQLKTKLDINILKQSLDDLIYPTFKGEHTVTSHIWNKTEVTVWQFQLNQIATGVDMPNLEKDVELNLDMALSSIRLWRNSLETSNENKQVVYNSNDLVYKLLDLENKLLKVQEHIED